MAATLSVYDPAMCCSTGVCGPSVDEKLVGLAADLAWLKGQGIHVERFNLGHQPGAFISAPLVLAEMGDEAEHLPVFVVNGAIAAKGRYPDRQEFASWFGLESVISSPSQRKELKVVQNKGCC